MSSKDLNDLFFEAFFDDTRKQTFRYKPLLDFVHFLHTYIYLVVVVHWLYSYLQCCDI